MIKEVFASLQLPCDKFEHYFPLYERHFGNFVGRSPRILEIGVQYGGSAEMWRNFFGEGTLVHGVDITPQCRETDYLKLSIGDQGDPSFWETTFQGQENTFDIIIDDGSHDNPHQITTLLATYGLLKDGGIYWCEDTHTSYYHGVRVRDGGYKNPNSFIEFSKSIVDVLHAHHTNHAIGFGPTPEGPHVPNELVNRFGRAQGIHFYDSVVVIEKGKPVAFVRNIHSPRQR